MVNIFLNDMTATEIAAEFGITRQAVHDMIRRCDKILADYEARLHLVAKFFDGQGEDQRDPYLIQKAS